MSSPIHFKSWDAVTSFLNKRRGKQLRVSYGTYMRLRDNRVTVYHYTNRQKAFDEWVPGAAPYLEITESGIYITSRTVQVGYNLRSWLGLNFEKIDNKDTKCNLLHYQGNAYILPRGGEAKIGWNGQVTIVCPTVRERRVNQKERNAFYKRLKDLRFRVRVVGKLQAVAPIDGFPDMKYRINLDPKKLNALLLQEMGEENPDVVKIHKFLNDSVPSWNRGNGKAMEFVDAFEHTIKWYRDELLQSNSARVWVDTYPATDDYAAYRAEKTREEEAAKQAAGE